MVKKNKLYVIAASLALVVGSITFSFRAREYGYEETHATYTNGDADTYYNGISDSLSGNALLTALRTLNLSKRQSTVGYSSMGTSPSGQFKYTDYDPDSVTTDSNGQPYGTRISSFYTYTSATSWNREHVWPNSHGGGSGGDAGSPHPDADIHMPRPTISSENSSRGNSFFVEGMNHNSNGWDPYAAGYSEQSRGEAARITFYCTLVNSKLNIAPNNTAPSGTDPITGTSYGSGHTMGNLETLLKWTINYPVTQRERNRNEGAEYLQGNRNAFVDHPEYACRIWGSVNSTTQSLCANANWDIGGSVNISKTTASLTVDATTTLTATSSDNSTITWSSNNTSVATVSTNSTASGGSVTVTAVSAGTAVITAKATIDDSEYKATCTVTVTTSGGGGGGGQSQESSYTIVPSDLATSYPKSPDTRTTASGLSLTLYQCATFNSKVQFKSGAGYLYNNSALKLSSLTINGLSGSLTVYGGSNANPSTAITGSNNVYDLTGYQYFKIANTSNNVATCSSIMVTTESGSVTPEKTLSSISLDTTNVKTNYCVGDTFSYSGLVVTANYSDSTSATVTPTNVSSPDMSSTGNKTVTVSYTEGGVTKTATYQITVSAAPITSITASVSKTYYVGETISSSDITVKDNNNNTIEGFTFANDGYQFTYSDAASGGDLTNKTFSNSITYSNLTCSLTAQVQRKARQDVSDPVSDTITASMLTATSTTYTSFSNVSATSTARYAGQSAKDSSGRIQLRSKTDNGYSGIVSTVSGGEIKSVTITVGTGTKVIDVYGKNTAYSSAQDLYSSSTYGTKVGSLSSTGTITFTTPYTYIGIRANNGAVYISSISISYGADDTAKNLANFIMYEDTVNQCNTKFTTATGYLTKLSAAERSTFANSDDYVISTARERLEAWAKALNKTINYTTGAVNSSIAYNEGENSSSYTAIIIIIASSLAISLALLLILNRRKKY